MTLALLLLLLLPATQRIFFNEPTRLHTRSLRGGPPLLRLIRTRIFEALSAAGRPSRDHGQAAFAAVTRHQPLLVQRGSSDAPGFRHGEPCHAQSPCRHQALPGRPSCLSWRWMAHHPCLDPSTLAVTDLSRMETPRLVRARALPLTSQCLIMVVWHGSPWPSLASRSRDVPVAGPRRDGFILPSFNPPREPLFGLPTFIVVLASLLAAMFHSLS